MIDMVRVEVTPGLERAIDRLHIMIGAGGTVLQLIAIIAQYGRMVDAMTRDVARGWADRREGSAHVKRHLEVAEMLVDRALVEIKPIHDGNS